MTSAFGLEFWVACSIPLRVTNALHLDEALLIELKDPYDDTYNLQLDRFPVQGYFFGAEVHSDSGHVALRKPRLSISDKKTCLSHITVADKEQLQGSTGPNGHSVKSTLMQ